MHVAGPRFVEAPQSALNEVSLTLYVALGAVIVGSATAIAPRLTVVATLAALVVFVVARRPEWGALIGMAALYSNAAVIGVRVHGLPFLMHGVVPLLFMVSAAYYIFVRRERVIVGSALIPLLALTAFQLASSLASVDPLTAIADVARFASEGLVLYVLVTNAIRTPAMLKGVTWVLLTVGAALGSLTLFQEYFGSKESDYFGFAQRIGLVGIGRTNEVRPSGPIFGDPNSYAEILLFLLPIGLMLVLSAASPRARILPAIATVLIAAGTALTYSRGAAIALGVVLLLMVLLRLVPVRQALLVVAVMAMIVMLIPSYLERLQSIGGLASVGNRSAQTDTSLVGRWTEVRAAELMVEDHPVLGVGPGLYPAHYRMYADRVPDFVQNEPRKPHNLYLGIAAETGLLGLAAFLAVIAIAIRDAVRARAHWATRNPELAAISAGIMLAIVASLTAGMFLHLAYQRYFWLFIGLAGVVGHLSARNGADDGRAGFLSRV